MRVKPVGWVAVAYDYDNDGRYDGMEYLYYYDLQKARQSSQRRGRDQARRAQQQRDGRQSMARSGDQRDRQRMRNSQDRQRSRLSGEVTKKGTTKVTMGQDDSADQKMTYIHLRTDSGKTVRAYIGSPDKVQQLDLSEGDNVTVEGVKARINDKKVLLARKVKANGESITNKMPRPEQWTRMRGEIRDVRNADGDDRGEPHVVVELKCKERTCAVDLGPKKALSNLDLQKGDRIAVLARKGKIGGQGIYIAQKLRANDRTIDVRKETTKSLTRGGNSQQDK